MRKLTLALVTAAIFAAGCLHLNELSLEERIAARHKVLVSDDWGGGHRIIFDFLRTRGG